MNHDEVDHDEDVARVHRLLLSVRSAASLAAPARLAQIEKSLNAIIGPKHARDMDHDEYMAALKEATRLG